MYQEEEVYDLVCGCLKGCLLDEQEETDNGDKLYMDIPMEQIIFIIERVLTPITVSVASSLIIRWLGERKKNKDKTDVREEELKKIQMEVAEETDQFTTPWGLKGLANRVTEKLSVNMEIRDDKDLETLMSIIRQFQEKH